MDRAQASPGSTFSRNRVATFDPWAPTAVVSLRGEHDIATLDELTATLLCAAALFDGTLTVDMEHVDFIDALTLGVIVASSNALRVQGRTLVVRSPSQIARRLLDLCGLNNLLDPCEGVPVPAAATLGGRDEVTTAHAKTG